MRGRAAAGSGAERPGSDSGSARRHSLPRREPLPRLARAGWLARAWHSAEAAHAAARRGARDAPLSSARSEMTAHRLCSAATTSVLVPPPPLNQPHRERSAGPESSCHTETQRHTERRGHLMLPVTFGSSKIPTGSEVLGWSRYWRQPSTAPRQLAGRRLTGWIL
eukprot:COSAG03_NODE_1513_length_3949_cov_7.782078_1_plen_165_part_00